MTQFEEAWKAQANAVHRNALEKGFWEDEQELEGTNHMSDRLRKALQTALVSRKLKLISDEVSEAHEAVRDDYPESKKIPGIGNFEEELADVVIRIMDLGQWMGLDIPGAIVKKMARNRVRPYKHGREF